jgi:hypothetical protein
MYVGMVKQEEWVTREKIATTAKVARYVVFNDAIGVDRTDTIDKDTILIIIIMIKSKRTQESVG